MKLLYVCFDCGKHFIGNDNKQDGRCCPECNGHLIPYTYGVDLSLGESFSVPVPRGESNSCG